VRRTLERIGLVAATTLAAVAATAYASGRSSQASFIDARPGQEVRFLHTNVTCVAPKGQVSGGQVGCDVSYAYWKNIFHPVPMKYDISLTLSHCIGVAKWSRSSRLLKSATVC
jgi:hypothetical protein